MPKVTESPWQQQRAQQQITCQSKHLMVRRACGSEGKISEPLKAKRMNKWSHKMN